MRSSPSGAAAADAADLLNRLAGEHRDLVLLLDRVALLRRVSEAARAAGGLDIGMIGEPQGSDEIVLRGHAGVEGNGLRGLVVPRGLGLGGKVAALGKPARVSDYVSSSTITHHFDEPVLEERVHAMLGVPMTFDGTFLGVCYVGLRRAAEFGDSTLDAVREAADAGAEQIYVADRLAERTDAAVTAERTRIAGELHDSVGAMLFTVGAQLRDMQTDPAASPELLSRLRRLERQIAETASMFRGSLAALDEAKPCERISAALTEDCRRLQDRSGVLARCVTVTEVPRLAPETGRAVLAAAREALLNVQKHAGASSAVLSVAGLEGGVSIAIADDGVGWQPTSEDQKPWSSGMGLRSASDRLERLGGSLSVVENEDGGLTVRIWAPCGGTSSAQGRT